MRTRDGLTKFGHVAPESALLFKVTLRMTKDEKAALLRMALHSEPRVTETEALRIIFQEGLKSLGVAFR